MGKYRGGTLVASLLAGAATLSGCGGGGGSGSSTPTTGTSTPISTPATPPPVATASCTPRDRQDWVLAQMKEWYLFPETLPTSLAPGGYADADSYLDALTANARAQGKDRYFTYLTSIKSEDAYYETGSSAGFGFRIGLDTGGRLFVTEAFEGGPALAAGLDRGTEILAIGASETSLRDTAGIYAAGGAAALAAALGEEAPNTSTALRFRTLDGTTRTATLTKRNFDLTPVSGRYGAQIIDDGGHRVGYVNLRSFISTADPALRNAFAGFRSAGVTEVIVDLRYNGGGLLSTAELLSSLLGGNRSTSDVQSVVSYRPEKASNNRTSYFQPQPQSVPTTRIAFIGTGGTASASEYVINAFTPYLHASSALIGTNTYGKPVGQIAIDRPGCDDRLRVIAFALQNAARQGAYFSGLAGSVEASCQASDDIGHPLGDPREASTRAALDFIEGKPCTRIAAGTSGALSLSEGASGRRTLLIPARPSTAQRETPGLF